MDRSREFRAKWAYVARRVPDGMPVSIGPQSQPSRAGDIVVARVTRVGSNDRLENRYGRLSQLYEGNLVVGAAGPVPNDDRTRDTGSVCLLTAGGLLGQVSSTDDVWDDPTKLEMIGPLVDDSLRPLSCESFARPLPPPATPSLGTVVVLGTDRRAGKTKAAVSIVRGWAAAGLDVGAGKATGHASGAERWAYLDGCAAEVTDYLDFGMPTTHGYPLERLSRATLGMRDALAATGVAVVVLELDGRVSGVETTSLLPRLRQIADAVVLAAHDGEAAVLGVEQLRDIGLPVRAITGTITGSAMTERRVAEQTGVPVITPEELAQGAAVRLLAPRTVSS